MQTDHHAPRPSCCIDIVASSAGRRASRSWTCWSPCTAYGPPARTSPASGSCPATRRKLRHGFRQARDRGADPDRLAGTENGIHRLIRTPPGQIRRRIALAGVRVSDFNRTPLPGTKEDWGGVIRSLIIDPHQAIKNHRTGFICTDIVAIFAGDLERFWAERPSQTTEPRRRQGRDTGRPPSGS